MNKRKIRDILRLLGAIVFSWLYIPHLFAYVIFLVGGKRLINCDLDAIRAQSGFDNLPYWLLLLDMLHNNGYCRVLFYHRNGAINVSIGAGSVVVKDIPDNSVAVGNPAEVIKNYT